ncbi:MAG: PEP-CTERM sorting domain-containing protein [Gemmobacter sp.]
MARIGSARSGLLKLHHDQSEVSMIKTFLAAAVALSVSGGALFAAPITFFGENLTPGNMVVGDPVTERNDFLATLAGGIGTETFEATSLPDISFPGSTGSITATLNGAASIVGSPGAGRFATSGSRYVQTAAGGDFSITFSSAIAAFGFYGTDIGDFGNGLILQLTKSGGSTVDLAVGNTVGSGGSTNGSLLFFGFIDLNETYTSIAFLNQPGGVDIFGFDDMTIGDRRQIVNPPVVPLPAALPLSLAALGLLGALKMRRRKTA